jgi:hypothetical protein
MSFCHVIQHYTSRRILRWVCETSHTCIPKHVDCRRDRFCGDYAPWIVQYAKLSRYLETNPRFLMFNELVAKFVWIFDINPGRRWQWHWVEWGKGGRRVKSFFSSRTKCDGVWAWKRDGGRLRCRVLNTDVSLSCPVRSRSNWHLNFWDLLPKEGNRMCSNPFDNFRISEHMSTKAAYWILSMELCEVKWPDRSENLPFFLQWPKM